MKGRWRRGGVGVEGRMISRRANNELRACSEICVGGG